MSKDTIKPVKSVPSKLFLNCYFKATLCNFDRDPLLLKPKLNDARKYIPQNSSFSKISSHFTEKMPAGFPLDVWRPLCLTAAFYFSETVTSNDPVLQLQLRSAGSLHVAFKNLRESQIWGSVVLGHHLRKIWPGFRLGHLVLLELLFYVTYERAR